MSRASPPTGALPAGRRRWRRRLGLGVASTLLSLLGALCLLELYLRWKLPEEADSPSMYELDLELGKRFLPGWRGKTLQADVTINAHGMRDDETSFARRPGALRIIALGDSWTFGSGVPQDQTWPQRLEALLGGPDRVEVLNTGVPGYETHHEALHYERDLGRFEHDLVLIGFYPVNDITDKERRYARYRRLHAIHPALLDLYLWPRRHLRLSQVYNDWRLRRKLARRQAHYAQRLNGSEGQVQAGLRAPGEDDWTLLYREEYSGWRLCRESLERLGRAARERGVRAAVVLFPDLRDLRRYAEQAQPRIAPLLAAAAEQAGLTLIDLVEDFRPWAGREPEISGGWGSTHPSPAGYQLIAAALARELRARQLLPALAGEVHQESE